MRYRSLILALAAVIGLASPAFAGDGRLDDLFERLRTAPSDGAADAVETEIWTIWLDHPGREVLTLMRQGVELLQAEALDEALDCFDQVVEADPAYAEGWNKRANTHYLRGEYDEAVADIRRTLTLEPRHFAALAGLGLVYVAIGQPQGAIRAFEAALAINPHLSSIRDQVGQLRRQTAGLPM